jgi:hypothetical protein
MNSGSTRLEAALVDLSWGIDWPQNDDLSGAVLRRLDLPRRRSYRRLAPALAAVAVVALLFTPPGKVAVAWLLRVAGIRIEFTDTTTTSPTITPTTLPRTLIVGESVTMDQAQAAADFPLRVPQVLPPPDSVQLTSLRGANQVAMVWNSSDQLLEVFESGTGLLLFQFRATVELDLLTKRATQATIVERLRSTATLATSFLVPHISFYSRMTTDR